MAPLNGTPPAPGPDQPRRRDRRLPAEHVEALVVRGCDDDECYLPIRGAGRRQPGIADPRRLCAVPPAPVGPAPQGVAFHPLAIGELEAIRGLPLHDHRSLLDGRHMGQQPRVAKQLSATTTGAGSCRHRRCRAAQVRSSITCNHVSLSRQGSPGPTGSGRRTTKSPGTTRVPSPITTSSRASMPSRARCSWPLYQVPTKPRC